MERVRTGDSAWTFPAAVVLGIGTVGVWLLYAAVTRAAVPSCELLPRTAWAFAMSGALAVFLLPFTYVPQPWLRLILAVLGAAAAGGLFFWGTAHLFPQFC